MRFWFLAFCLSVLFIHTPSNAQVDTRGIRIVDGEIVMGKAMLQRYLRDWQRITPRHERVYREVINSMYENDNMIEGSSSEARYYYAKSYDYTPFSKEIIDRMTVHAFRADTSEDIAEINDALFKYREILKTHLVNYDVLDYALSLAKLDTKYGSASFLTKVKKAIQRDLQRGNDDGLSPNRSHKVITFGEENYLLRRHGGIVQDSEIYQVGATFFNVHNLIGKDGRERMIYFNISEPLVGNYLRRTIRERQESLNIPGQ